jgi:hypothetical protein
MPLRTRKLTRTGDERQTTISQRDASSGGPAKFEWSIHQPHKHEIKLTQGQMLELILFVRSWMRDKENPVMVCGCSYPIEQRINPTTGAYLLLCHYHAELHDSGAAFDVYPS